MGRATAEEAATRRQRVAELELRGAPPHVIAREVGSDVRTVQRDLQALAAERARDTDLAAERHRLLGAARAVEAEAWRLYDSLPAEDANGKLGALAKVLAAQAQGAKVTGDLAGADVERRLAELEQRLADVRPAAVRRVR